MGEVLIAGLALAACPALDVALQDAVTAAVVRYEKQDLKSDQIWMTAIDLSEPKWKAANYRGAVTVYPASVVKLFYMAYAAHRVETGALRLTPALERGVRDMIVDSSNDATGYVLDAVCETTPGPELAPHELAPWMEKRRAVNRWFASLKYEGVFAQQRTYNEGPYGRERQSYGENWEHRNALSANATARLMAEIIDGRIASQASSAWMRGFLSRKLPGEDRSDFQSRAFIGKVLPSGSQLWSKAGYVNFYRHDVAGIQLPDGRRFVFAIYTHPSAQIPELVPFLAHRILVHLGVTPEPFAFARETDSEEDA
jgi:hypothetical protein